jgi:hypothetical protein
MRLMLDLPTASERVRVFACVEAERVLSEHGITLTRLHQVAKDGSRKYQAERTAYTLASAAAVRFLSAAGVPPVDIDRARFLLLP